MIRCILIALTLPFAVYAATPVRVMSYNLRYATAKDGVNAWDNRKDFLIQTIATFDPDLLGTQETLLIQRDFLLAKLDGYESFGVGRDDGKEKGEMAALFFRKARFEKIDGGHFWLSETPETVGSKGWDAALPRVATWVKLKDRTSPKAMPVLFLNTHFDHRGEKAGQNAASLIRTKIAELGKDCRIVVTGDFNAGEGSPPYTALFGDADGKQSAVVDTFRVRTPKRTKAEGTFSEFKANLIEGDRIDWIGCSRDWEVRLAAIDRTSKDGRTPSDHFPVTAVLRPIGLRDKLTLRVMTYNIHHGEGTDGKLDLLRIAKVIRAADPDLVALQEVDNKAKRTGGVDQAAELAKLTGLHGEFGKAIDLQGGAYGQAILSRYPLSELKVHMLPNEGKREQRIALAAKAAVNDSELTFITTHLDHQDNALREQQAAKLNALFADGERSTVLAGDLNADPASKPFTILSAKWSSSIDNLPTFPADKPTTQIDYILLRPHSKFFINSTSVIDERVASDHRPLVVEVTGLKK